MSDWMDFAAVLFDVDGVLLDTMGFHVDAWVRAGRELGIDIQEEDVYRREGELAMKSAKDFIKNANMMSTRARAQTLLERKQDVYKRIAGKPKAFPGVMKLLAQLRDDGKRLAYVTGTSRAEMEQTMSAEMKAFFDGSVCGNEVLHGKPNPEPYMKAMSLLSVSSQECLVIENAPYGIRSGKSAQATVWAVRSYLPEEDLREADRIFESVEDILNGFSNIDKAEYPVRG